MKEIEIICLNDGSTDNSLSILKEYASKDNRIKVIDKENEGLGYTRKVGLDNSSGEYILFCDSDDYYAELTAFEKLYNFAIEKNVDIVGFDFYHVSFNSKYKNRFYFIPNFSHEEIFTYKDLENINSINTSSCIRLYSKSFFDSYNDWYFPKKTFYEDTPFHFQALFRAKFSYLQEPFYVYEMRDNSITTKFKTDKNFVDVYTTTKVAFDFVNSLDIENEKELLNQLLFFIYKAIKRFTPEQFRDYINKKQAKEQNRKVQEQNIKIYKQDIKIQELNKKVEEQNKKVEGQNKKVEGQNKKVQE